MKLLFISIFNLELSRWPSSLTSPPDTKNSEIKSPPPRTIFPSQRWRICRELQRASKIRQFWRTIFFFLAVCFRDLGGSNFVLPVDAARTLVWYWIAAMRLFWNLKKEQKLDRRAIRLLSRCGDSGGKRRVLCTGNIPHVRRERESARGQRWRSSKSRVTHSRRGQGSLDYVRERSITDRLGSARSRCRLSQSGVRAEEESGVLHVSHNNVIYNT